MDSTAGLANYVVLLPEYESASIFAKFLAAMERLAVKVSNFAGERFAEMSVRATLTLLS